MKVDVKVSIDRSSINQKIESLVDDDVMLQVNQLFAETVEPWTPFLTGNLSQSVLIDSTGVTYTVPYAKDKYFGTVYHKEVHPLATSHWDEVAMQTEMPAFKEKVKQILIKKAKQLYG